VNSKEENSLDFCPNYVQQFGLRVHKWRGGGGAGRRVGVWGGGRQFEEKECK
jgi:hypothetical protein